MTRSRLARGSAAVAVAMAAIGCVLMWIADVTLSEFASRSYAQDGIVAVAYPAVGAVIVSRQPRNAIGWIFCAVGLLLGATLLAGAFTVYSAERGTTGLAVELAGWFETWAWIFAHGLVAILLLTLFPEGRFRSGRAKLLGWVGMAATAITAVAVATYPGLRAELAAARGASGDSRALELFPEFRANAAAGLDNPFGIEGAESVLTAVGAAGAVTILLCTLAAAASLVLQLRHARGVERQQLKWIAFAGAALALGAAATLPLDQDALVAPLLQALVLGPIVALATGFAILRHRLYDVDVVINRTLVYGALTATLAGAYLGSVLLLQLVMSPSSDLAIAGSTLAVAALFRPARARIQELVDRRFYRRRYDAARTLERFGTRLRDEVSLDSLSVELRAVVEDTMQPAHVSLWLPPEVQR